MMILVCLPSLPARERCHLVNVVLDGPSWIDKLALSNLDSSRSSAFLPDDRLVLTLLRSRAPQEP